MLGITDSLSSSEATPFCSSVLQRTLLNLHSSCSLKTLVRHAFHMSISYVYSLPLDIERMYGQRKPIAQRTPLILKPSTTRPMSPPLSRPRPLTAPLYSESPTPAATEGETTETETELETELEDSYIISNTLAGGNSASDAETRPRSHSLTQHDLMNFFFRKDVIILRNVDLLRYVSPMFTCIWFSHHGIYVCSASDVKLVLLLGYAIAISFFLPLLHSPRALLGFHFLHALSWRFIHSFALGLVLKAQSDSKFLVRHFITHYHYPGKEAGRDALREAFNNWKALYNLSLCMTYGMCMVVLWMRMFVYVVFTLNSFVCGACVADVFYPR